MWCTIAAAKPQMISVLDTDIIPTKGCQNAEYLNYSSLLHNAVDDQNIAFVEQHGNMRSQVIQLCFNTDVINITCTLKCPLPGHFSPVSNSIINVFSHYKKGKSDNFVLQNVYHLNSFRKY